MAKDFYRDNVRIALEKDGWKITDDPYRMKGFHFSERKSYKNQSHGLEQKLLFMIQTKMK